MDRCRIKDLPEQERPRERLESQGVEALSSAELLAIILRTGAAGKTAVELANLLLSQFSSLKELSSAGIQDISGIKGIGVAKACQIAAAFELGRRAAGSVPARLPFIRNPEDLFNIVNPELGNLKQESFRVALLNSRLQLIRIAQISVGTLTASMIHPRETFRPAIAERCQSVILVHNHPSGDPTPSDDDVKITRRIVEVGELLEIKVVDHIIIGGGTFKSMKDSGFIA